MLFRVKNLGLIDEAEIKLDGITVITGKNNVGKSTIGRMLYCVNNVFMRDSVENMKMNRIRRLITNNFRDLSMKARRSLDSAIKKTDLLPSLLYDIDVSLHSLNDFFEQLFESEGVSFDNDMIEVLKGDILKVVNKRGDSVISELFHIARNVNFSGDLYNIYGKNYSTEIELKSHNLDIHIVIKTSKNPLMVGESTKPSFEEAIYIENPYVVHDADKLETDSDFLLTFDSRQRIVQLLTDNSGVDFLEKEEIGLEIGGILEKISGCAPGELVKDSPLTNKLVYEEENRRFDLVNVSSGVKTFAILKSLLTNGKLKRNGMLILDEPEVHLHPEWQLVFAEILVLLQKQFNLTTVISTHSVYFLMAIEDYSKMHQVDKNCNYYIIERKEGRSSCRDCTDTLNEIYQHFADAFDTLHNEVRK